MTDVRLIFLATVLAATVDMAAVAQMQPRQPVRIAVNDPRPVAAAAESLERHFGWVVTYEDPQWAASSETQDVTEAVRRDLAGTPLFMRNLGPRVYVPKGGSLQFEVAPNVAAGSSVNARINLLNEMLLAHAAAGNPGIFGVQEGASGRIHIVGLAAKNVSERVVPQQPVLDRGISLETRQYGGLEFLQTFAEAVSGATGVRMEVGTTPVNTFAHHSGSYGASNEPGRNLLERFLNDVGVGYSWQLFFDPVERLYVLNIHWVASREE